MRCMEAMEMLFNEVYSSYFDAVSEILNKAVAGGLDERTINKIVADRAFSESILTIPRSVRNQWALVNEDFTTPITKPPKMPLTTLEKRWLKALLDDPRIRLFEGEGGAEILRKGLEGVEPLFDREMIVNFDQYSDGDDFEDEGYIENFKTVLEACKLKRSLQIDFVDKTNRQHRWDCVPHWIEYSAKDDKFRLITTSMKTGRVQTINVGRITKCRLMEPFEDGEYKEPMLNKQKLVLELVDKRNALERVMLHFSDLAKEAEHMDGERYRLTLRYDKEDETELLIRVLSFGPLVQVISPQPFIDKLNERLEKQKQFHRT